MYKPLDRSDRPSKIERVKPRLLNDLIIQPFQTTIDRLMLLQEQKRGNRVWTQPDETRHPTFEHPPDALVLDGPAQQPEQAFRLLGAHDARLDHVDGAADCRRHEPCE